MSEKIEAKKKKWKQIKTEFLKDIPKRFKVTIDGLDADSNYAHPIIELDDDLVIRCQIDIGSNYVYGFELQMKSPLTLSQYIYTLKQSIYDREQLLYIVNNYEKIKSSLMESFKEIEKIYVLQEELKKVQENIVHMSITEEIDRLKLQGSINSLYSVSEYLENKRLNI